MRLLDHRQRQTVLASGESVWQLEGSRLESNRQLFVGASVQVYRASPVAVFDPLVADSSHGGRCIATFLPRPKRTTSSRPALHH
jgi:hypothetical protein